METFVLLLTAVCIPVSAAEPIHVLVVDGANNHDWRALTEAVQAILRANGDFVIDVATSPAPSASADAWAEWRPRFGDYDVVVNEFNGGHLPDGLRWPREVEQALEEYVRGGGGLVNIHAANNAFLEWPAYNEMIGLGWRDPSFGESLIVENSGKIKRIPAGEGRKPGHGPSHDFVVTTLDGDHPIYRGVPKAWLHPFEQLTHGQHGPAKNLTVLSYAWSKDTNENEPMDWVIPFGQGRVYTTMLGHTSTGRISSNRNLRCVGFQTVLARAVEWAATGKVTIPVPADFPTEKEASLNTLIAPNDSQDGLVIP
ncbi:MAG: ThuA domain-containing protein [Bryobacterales bacterium]|nr:ThuA domain-containing protein [Acidobacteriota bacterium]MCB9385192.1 ThuA domain-containing protein [Bryobacterales bacterium]